MNRTIIRINAQLKGLVLLIRPGAWLGWLERPLLAASNILGLTRWIARQPHKGIMNDFFTAKRDYSKRYLLYQYVVDQFKLYGEAVDYLEFGVSGGFSFKWWVAACPHPETKFFGFDTFQGLPEDWGTYQKGEMSAQVPQIEDNRVTFIAGLFQETLPVFLQSGRIGNKRRKIIHLDADLFTATLFTLTSLAPHLRKGDILFFDEFNVPNHEFFAFRIFCDSFYFKTRLLGAVNNYYQVAMIIE
ncbi:MAG TPA: class I SAM-dependent methyltransferase [Bacteroidales bacterium]|nr:class I SAM-dependent methyltransferase [Bacteroidales bacterium]HSA43245.1 class I SAM-dependent methyltransferase [Bacteroidales bacterium]